MPATSIFSFFHSVFKRLLPRRRQKAGSCKKELKQYIFYISDYLENLKTATTSTTKTMTTTSQPVTTDSTRSKNHLLLAVIGSVALLPAFFALFIYIPKATSRIGLHQDAESGNSQESIELQSLTNTAEPESNGTPAMDRNGDDNRQDNAAETLHLAAIYESKNNCIRIHGVESLPAQRAIRIDGVESLPAQRAQLPDSTEQNHSHP